MATQITATLPALDFPKEVDYPTQEDWAAFSAAAEENFGILGGDWSTQMQLWKDQANAMSIESNNNADLAQSIANYQGDWISQGYTLGQSVSVSGVYYICKLTHATGQNPTTGGSIYWNLALGNWSLKVNNYGNETIDGIKTFTSSPIVPTPTTDFQVATKKYVDDTSVLKIDNKKDASDDIDLILTGGLYSYSVSTTNLPTGALTAGTLIVNEGVNTSARSQILIDAVDRMWIRYGDSGWNSWNEVVTINSFTQLLATEGYAKLPNGLIFQWGVTATSSSGTETFPIVFPNACFGVQVTNNITNNSGFVSSFNKTSFVWSNSTTVTIHYLAIGN